MIDFFAGENRVNLDGAGGKRDEVEIGGDGAARRRPAASLALRGGRLAVSRFFWSSLPCSRLRRNGRHHRLPPVLWRLGSGGELSRRRPHQRLGLSAVHLRFHGERRPLRGRTRHPDLMAGGNDGRDFILSPHADGAAGFSGKAHPKESLSHEVG